MLSGLKAWFADLAMTRKIAVGQGIVAVFVVLFLIVTLLQMSTVRQATDRAANTYEASVLLRTAHAELVDINGLVRGILITRSDFLFNVFDDTMVRYRKAFADYQARLEPGDPAAAKARELGGFVDELVDNIYEVQLDHVRSGNEARIAQAFAMETEGTSWPYLEKVLITIGELMEGQAARQAEQSDVMRAAFDTQRTVLVVWGILIVLLIILFSWQTGGIISKPVVKITEAMRALAGGAKDTDVPYQERSDEIGDISKAVLVFRDAMQEVETLAEQQKEQQAQALELAEEQAKTERAQAEQREAEAANRAARQAKLEDMILSFESRVLESIKQLEDASGTLDDSADSMMATAQGSQGEVTRVSGTSSEMQSEAGTMAAAVEEFTASLAEVTRNVGEANTLSNEASEASQRGAATVAELGSAAAKIDDVVTLINEIAEQTNLLALNATIEAARAGDAGKGFAVVASEVKNLATQTAKATEEISAQVRQMQDVASTVGDAIGETDEKMKTLDGVLDQVVGAIQEQEASSGQLSQTATVTLNGSQQVADGLAIVVDGANQASEASGDVKMAVANLNETASSLRTDVDSFLREYGAFKNSA